MTVIQNRPFSGTIKINLFMVFGSICTRTYLQNLLILWLIFYSNNFWLHKILSVLNSVPLNPSFILATIIICYFKGTVQWVVLIPFFHLTMYPVPTDTPTSDFKFCWIFVELFVFEILKNRLPAILDSREPKIEPKATLIFESFKMFLVSSAKRA